MDIEITDDMAEAGARVLCDRAEGFSLPGRYRLALEAAREIYRAMAAAAPLPPNRGKAEPAPTFEGAPGNVVQMNPRKP